MKTKKKTKTKEILITGITRAFINFYHPILEGKCQHPDAKFTTTIVKVCPDCKETLALHELRDVRLKSDDRDEKTATIIGCLVMVALFFAGIMIGLYL